MAFSFRGLIRRHRRRPIPVRSRQGFTRTVPIGLGAIRLFRARSRLGRNVVLLNTTRIHLFEALPDKSLACWLQ